MKFVISTAALFILSIGAIFPVAAATTMINPNQQGRILGGQAVLPGEIPYQLSLQYNGRHFCGASLIQIQDIQLAVTAAHCVYDREFFQWDLVAGEVSLSKTSGHGQTRRVANIVIHANYNPRDISNDIALLFLFKSFKLNKNVSTIALPNELQETFGNVTASGWGYLQSGAANTADKLQKITIQVISDGECKKFFPDYTHVTDGTICAKDPNEKQSVCKGDSGGPAVATEGAEGSYLAGVASFAYLHGLCGNPGFPHVYTRVSKYVDWMKRMV